MFSMWIKFLHCLWWVFLYLYLIFYCLIHPLKVRKLQKPIGFFIASKANDNTFLIFDHSQINIQSYFGTSRWSRHYRKTKPYRCLNEWMWDRFIFFIVKPSFEIILFQTGFMKNCTDLQRYERKIVFLIVSEQFCAHICAKLRKSS